MLQNTQTNTRGTLYIYKCTYYGHRFNSEYQWASSNGVGDKMQIYCCQIDCTSIIQLWLELNARVQCSSLSLGLGRFLYGCAWGHVPPGLHFYALSYINLSNTDSLLIHCWYSEILRPQRNTRLYQILLQRMCIGSTKDIFYTWQTEEQWTAPEVEWKPCWMVNHGCHSEAWLHLWG